MNTIIKTVCCLIFLLLGVSCQKDALQVSTAESGIDKETNIAMHEFLLERWRQNPDFHYLGKTYAAREHWGEDVSFKHRATGPLRAQRYRMNMESLYAFIGEELGKEGVDPTVFNSVYSGSIQTLGLEITHRAGLQQGGLAEYPSIGKECIEWLYVQRAIDLKPYAEVLLALQPLLTEEDFKRHSNYILTTARGTLQRHEAEFDRRREEMSIAEGDREKLLQLSAQMHITGRSYVTSRDAVDLLTASVKE